MISRLLTARDTAELLGVSAAPVLRWVWRGKLPSIRPCGSEGERSGAVTARQEELFERLHTDYGAEW